MAIIVDERTRLVVQGLTGSEGRFHGLRNRGYGTQVVAGVTPGKGGQDVEGIPVFDTVAGARLEIADVRIFRHTFDLDAWLARTGCEGEEAVEVVGLLGDRAADGRLTLDKIAILARKGN